LEIIGRIHGKSSVEPTAGIVASWLFGDRTTLIVSSVEVVGVTEITKATVLDFEDFTMGIDFGEYVTNGDEIRGNDRDE
jgi:hypothetical protein